MRRGQTAATAGTWAQFRRVLVFVSLLSPEAKEWPLGRLGSVLREGCSGSGRFLRITKRSRARVPVSTYSNPSICRIGLVGHISSPIVLCLLWAPAALLRNCSFFLFMFTLA